MKVKNLFDVAAIAKHEEAARKSFGDSFAGKAFEIVDASDAGVVLSRQLSAVDPAIFTKRYAGLNFLNAGIEVSNFSTDLNTVQSLRLAETGDFADGSGNNRNEGVISLKGDSSQISVDYKDAVSNWNDREARQASLQGYSYVNRLLEAHSSLYQRKIDYIGLLGNGTQLGVLNYTGYTSISATGTFNTLTGAQMFDDVVRHITTQWNGVSNTPEYMGNVYAMPIITFNLLNGTLINTANASNVSVLTLLKQTYPDITFYGTSKATTASVFYSNNREAGVFRIPNPLTISDITKNGFNYEVQSEFGVAGMDFLVDEAGYKMTGVAA